MTTQPIGLHVDHGADFGCYAPDAVGSVIPSDGGLGLRYKLLQMRLREMSAAASSDGLKGTAETIEWVIDRVDHRAPRADILRCLLDVCSANHGIARRIPAEEPRMRASVTTLLDVCRMIREKY